MIKCIDFKPHESKSLLGFATLVLEKQGLQIKHCAYMRKNESTWVQMPTRKEGEKWVPIIQFIDKSMNEAFQTHAKKAIENYLYENRNKSPL